MSTTSDEAQHEALCAQARELAESGRLGEAAELFERVLAAGEGPCLAQAALGLAVLREDAGDLAGAREADALAIATGDPEYGPRAAYELAQRLLERGEPGRAQRVLAAALRSVDPDGAPDAYARLAVTVGIAYLDRAIGAFEAALDAPRMAADPQVGPLATELLARTLPLRGRTGEAARAWRRGLAEPGTAAEVRARLRRDFAERGDGELPWWEPVVESAVADGTLPALAGEAFAVLDRVYGLVAARYEEGAGELGEALEVPAESAWGGLLRESVADRLTLILGSRSGRGETARVPVNRRDPAP